MSGYAWYLPLNDLFAAAIERYRAGHRDLDSFFTVEETAALARMGYRPIDLYDVAEDACVAGEPDWETVLLVAAVRREYFLAEQNGLLSQRRWDAATFPAKDAALDGVHWLPRIAAKARAKLRGELPRDLMYGCGGDRAFLRRHGVDAAEFLQAVWNAGDDDRAVLLFLRSRGVPAEESAGPRPVVAGGDFCPI